MARTVASFLSRKRWQLLKAVCMRTSPRKLVEIRYRERLGTWPDLDRPQTLNEKILWLLLYGDTSQWPELADKYRVRDYVARCGLGHLLNELYGVWDSAEELDFDDPRLPDAFVLKTTNGCGDVVVIADRKSADPEAIRRKMRRALSRRFGRTTAEYHYLAIPPRIIAERLLPADPALGRSMVDYKFFCFDGTAHYCMVCYDRRGSSVYTGLYDARTWENLTHYVTGKYYDPEQRPIPRPASLDEMRSAAERLARNDAGGGFAQVRIDFYEVAGRPIFGEMTFASAAGVDTGFTPEFQRLAGSLITLPQERIEPARRAHRRTHP